MFTSPAFAPCCPAPHLSYIEHGIIHIVRVAPFQKFKGLIHGHPIILESRKDPCVCPTPASPSLFRLNGAFCRHRGSGLCKCAFAAYGCRYVFNDPTFRKAEATIEASFVNVNGKVEGGVSVTAHASPSAATIAPPSCPPPCTCRQVHPEPDLA